MAGIGNRVSGRARAAMTALFLAGGSLALALAPAAIAATATVDIVGFSFAPGSLTVTVGDTVTWTNADAQSHTATADGGAFDTGTIAGGASGAVTVTTAGTFAYHCAIHPAMTATLVVTAAAAPPATDTEVGAVDGSPAEAPGAIGWLALASLAGVALAARRFGRRATERTIGACPGGAPGRLRAPGA